MRIRKDGAIALMIDMQERLFPVMQDKQEILDRCRILLEGIRILDLPLLVTEQYPRGLGPTLPSLAEAATGFRPIEKITFSCTDEASFMEALEKSGRKQVLICGIEAHVCVLQTVVDLLQLGYQPVVLTDACSSRKERDREVAFRRMEQEGALLSTVESALFELTRGAGTDEFKQISKLVK